jgi:hypothetical protein
MPLEGGLAERLVRLRDGRRDQEPPGEAGHRGDPVDRAPGRQDQADPRTQRDGALLDADDRANARTVAESRLPQVQHQWTGAFVEQAQQLVANVPTVTPDDSMTDSENRVPKGMPRHRLTVSDSEGAALVDPSRAGFASRLTTGSNG